MKTIGVCGVTIPGAVDCIQKINQHSSRYFLTNEHPHVILYQPNFGPMQTSLKANNWPQVLIELTKSIEALTKAGADFAIVPANSVHKVIYELQKLSPIPILNMLEIVSNECKKRNIQKVGILGTIWTMSGHLYKESLASYGIEEIIPNQNEQTIVQNAIFNELIPTGKVSPSTFNALLGIVASLKNAGCDGITLACTELPLVLNEENCGMPVIDSTDVLAIAAVKRCAEGLLINQ